MQRNKCKLHKRNGELISLQDIVPRCHKCALWTHIEGNRGKCRLPAGGHGPVRIVLSVSKQAKEEFELITSGSEVTPTLETDANFWCREYQPDPAGYSDNTMRQTKK